MECCLCLSDAFDFSSIHWENQDIFFVFCCVLKEQNEETEEKGVETIGGLTKGLFFEE